ncbi:Gfo/Idh/MocA family protein [Nesterenkonia haasae]|uniref:Gfo/Idh/MocA family protein n=1 Tax=Nesterenkonia haasae TaxID=2587813 RepID=UPI001390936F|nr:Gfo/Idh/MocA family oxidoreductase [Nesterenkonia haasae]
MSAPAQHLTLGVLGVGRIGRMHAAHLAMRSDVESVILFGRDRERLAASVKAVVNLMEGSPGFAAGSAAAAQKLIPRVINPRRQEAGGYHGVDGLIIAASTDSHRQLVAHAVGAGVPLLIEKPLAATVGEQQELIRLLRESGVSCMMGYHRRFDDDHRRLREQLASGELGTARGAIAVSLDYRDAEESYVPSSGGLWRDLAVHDFNALAWVLDDHIVSVAAYSAVLGNPMYRRYGDVDTASAILTFSSGVTATVLCGRHMGCRQETRLEVHGTSGTGSTENVMNGSRAQVPADEPESRAAFTDSMSRFRQAYVNEIDEFVQLVRGTDRGTSPPTECLAALKVAMAAEESVKAGRTIDVL